MPYSTIPFKREKNTIRLMIGIYCRGHHHAKKEVCGTCMVMLHHAMACIDRCPYQKENKPVCGLCPTQCFDADKLRQFKHVMSYAGPRMLMAHPILSMLHCLDALKTVRRG